MKPNQWKDESSYSRGERGTKEPTVWNLELEGLRVTVHRYRGYGDEWFGSCHQMSVQQHSLSSADVAGAKAEFLNYLRTRAEHWLSRIGTAAYVERELGK